VKKNPAIFYIPLESVKSRYTHDLCEKGKGWMPSAINRLSWREIHHVDPDVKTAEDIVVGAVLDSQSRSRYCAAQMQYVCNAISVGQAKTGDVLFLQDFWTPGLETVLYHAHLSGVKLRIYAMLHAQSVDEYDFTYGMRSWMRHIELGYASAMAGIFVASTIHYDQLRSAGFTCPIHVVGLPYGMQSVANNYPTCSAQKVNAVVSSSRLDTEKQPEFMLKVAKKFLAAHPSWEWWVTTSSTKFRSYNNAAIIPKLRAYADINKRFVLMEGLSKGEYHSALGKANIQFNCSLQDYVSWTLLEALHRRCTPVYPNFRSFPEIFKGKLDRMYAPWSVSSALLTLTLATKYPPQLLESESLYGIPSACSDFRHRIVSTMYYARTTELNLWKELK